MKPLIAIVGLLAVLSLPAAGQGLPPLNLPWKRAVLGWEYAWPRDHAAHPEFKTEWWYLTGNLRDPEGRRFGYELTFFRRGLRLPDSAPAQSRFVMNDFKFGHFTITDPAKRRFLVAQQMNRGAFGEAGFGDGVKDSRLAWLGAWSLHLEKDGSFRARAEDQGSSLDLTLVPQKPWIPHGRNGVSIKSAREQTASHYYSGTRLRSTGTLSLDGKSFAVSGDSWFDREWASDPLAPDQAGWDWFSLQFEDGSDLMLYRLRRKDGTIDAASSGTFVAADGTTRAINAEEMEMRPIKLWRSKATGGEYPVAWSVRIPSLQLEVEVTTPLECQELSLEPVTYWEGMVDVAGKRAGSPMKGHGYVELTGYAGPLKGLATPGR